MGDTKDRKNRVAGSHGLESRLDELERRLGAAGDTTAEMESLREAVDDLGADILDLYNQMEKLVSSCERILAGAGGGSELGLDRRTSIRGSASALKRVTGRAVRSTLGAARRLMNSRPNDPAAGPDLQTTVAATPVTEAPRLAVVVHVTEDPGEVDPAPALTAQTETDLEVVVWNEESSAAVIHANEGEPIRVEAPDRSTLARSLAADSVAEIKRPLPRIEPTTLEICRWTIASEAIPLIVDAGAATSADRSGWSLLPKGQWSVLEGTGGDTGAAGLTKLVGGRSWHPAGHAISPMIGVGGGCGYLAPPGADGSFSHEVAPLSGVVKDAAGDDQRPAVLLVSSKDGLALVSWLLRGLAENFRLIVAITDAGVVGSTRHRALGELVPEIYPIADFLDPGVHESIIHELIRAHGVRSVVRIGSSVELADNDDSRPFVIDLPLDRREVGDGANLVLAVGAEIADASRARGIETADLVVGPELAGEIPQADRLGHVRSAYGVPDDALLVLTIGELVPDLRPEDTAAVARRLRDRDDVFFLLIGEGPLSGTVSDMAGYFRLDRFSQAPASHSLIDLVASCDCLLSPAERDPWPVSIAAALAVGRAVVATEIDGVRELVAAADGDRCVLCEPGDVAGLADAVIDALDNHRRPMMTKKAWAASTARSGRCLAIVREALGRGMVDDTRQS